MAEGGAAMAGSDGDALDVARRVCARCGADISGRHHNARLCKVCAARRAAEARARWNAAHRDRMSARQRKWAAAHPEALRKSQKDSRRRALARRRLLEARDAGRGRALARAARGLEGLSCMLRGLYASGGIPEAARGLALESLRESLRLERLVAAAMRGVEWNEQ